MRRELLNHVVVFNERQLRRLLWGRTSPTTTTTARMLHSRRVLLLVAFPSVAMDAEGPRLHPESNPAHLAAQ